jgi:hypothetical protein
MLGRKLLQVEEGVVVMPVIMQPGASGQGQIPEEQAQHSRCRPMASK